MNHLELLLYFHLQIFDFSGCINSWLIQKDCNTLRLIPLVSFQSACHNPSNHFSKAFAFVPFCLVDKTKPITSNLCHFRPFSGSGLRTHSNLFIFTTTLFILSILCFFFVFKECNLYLVLNQIIMKKTNHLKVETWTETWIMECTISVPEKLMDGRFRTQDTILMLDQMVG